MFQAEREKIFDNFIGKMIKRSDFLCLSKLSTLNTNQHLWHTFSSHLIYYKTMLHFSRIELDRVKKPETNLKKPSTTAQTSPTQALRPDFFAILKKANTSPKELGSE
jgi:hypothetical protein